jgi:hypothetical protein
MARRPGLVAAIFVAWFSIGYTGLSVANVVIVPLGQTVTTPLLVGRMTPPCA